MLLLLASPSTFAAECGKTATMHLHAHTPSAPRSLRVAVVTVSTSRSSSSDRSGPLLAQLLQGQGHEAVEPTIVPDDPQEIGAVLDRLLAEPSVEAVLLTGGTGISARDCTPSVLRQRLDREISGFGELFRLLSFQQVGAAAMLSDAVGGVARGKPVFALPGSTKACELGMEKLILPELAHMVAELGKETPLPRLKSVQAPPALPAAPPAPEVEPPPQGISVRPMPGSGERKPELDLPTGWRAGLRAMGGTLTPDQSPELPESMQRMAAACDVLNSAGERGRVTLPNGREYTAFGFPDLVRNSSKVLLLRDAWPQPEVVALHRWPRRVGICAEDTDSILPPSTSDVSQQSIERTGRPYMGPGSLFAVESTSIYLVDRKKVAQWDGRRNGSWDPLNSMMGTLILYWSQK